MRVLVVGMCLTVAAGHSSASITQDLVVGNSIVSRTLSAFAGPIRTTKLEVNGAQVLAQPGVEFLIDIDYKDDVVTLAPSDLEILASKTAKVGQELRTTVEMRSRKEGFPGVLVSLMYHSLPTAPFLQKSLAIKPAKGLEKAVLRRVTLEYCSLKPEFTAVSPAPAVGGEGGQRFTLGQRSDFAAMDPKTQSGLFFFMGSFFGRESFRQGTLVMGEDVYIPLDKGYETGRATIGSVSGPPEILYKRFREFLWDNYCSARGRPALTVGDGPGGADFSERACLDRIKVVAEEGCYDAFHLGPGWASHYPLTEDPARLPSGIPGLASQAGAVGLKMAYSVGPLASSGQSGGGTAWDGLLKDHPDWFASRDAPGSPAESGGDVLSFTTPYADFVEGRLARLLTEGNAALLRLDGADWFSFSSPASGRYHVGKQALPFAVLSRHRAICESLRGASKDLVIRLSVPDATRPASVHWLNTVDQIEVPVDPVDGCLGERRQRYGQAFAYPLPAVGAGWRSIDPAMPLPQLKYALISSISASAWFGAGPAGPEASAYLKRFHAFRKRFGEYFGVYQHVLGWPDGRAVDGVGHIIANKGFVVLYNPSDKPQEIAVPLDEPELELKGQLSISDWTELESGTDLCSANPGDRVKVQIGPVSAKIIGINLSL